tara:strand:- start:135 stop:257 length:123 start_codon:yes stop_codon:yes gene_type:complete
MLFKTYVFLKEKSLESSFNEDYFILVFIIILLTLFLARVK